MDASLTAVTWSTLVTKGKSMAKAKKTTKKKVTKKVAKKTTKKAPKKTSTSRKKVAKKTTKKKIVKKAVKSVAKASTKKTASKPAAKKVSKPVAKKTAKAPAKVSKPVAKASEKATVSPVAAKPVKEVVEAQKQSLQKAAKAKQQGADAASGVKPKRKNPKMIASPPKPKVEAEPKKKPRISIPRISPDDALDQLTKKWGLLQQRAKKLEVRDYNMRMEFEELTPIRHKTMGWGFILRNINDRLEVLFEDGIKYLISNYKR